MKRQDIWSVRMRASRSAGRRRPGIKGRETVHISGAEGIYGSPDLEKIVGGYLLRAMSHSRGQADEIVITVESMTERPLAIPLLPVSAVPCSSPDAAQGLIRNMLEGAGISEKAIEKGLKVVTAGKTMRGASLIRSGSGVRAEPDRARGVRVSRLGNEDASEKRLSSRLSRSGINTSTVKEAITLASKVASCPGVIAELCVSDDPDYTTGYLASRSMGYVRIPNIKRDGSLSGGRVFFIEEGADVDRIIGYLETTPVLVG